MFSRHVNNCKYLWFVNRLGSFSTSLSEQCWLILNTYEYTLVKFEWKCNWRKLIWECRLQSGSHFSRPRRVVRYYNKMQDVLWCVYFCGYDALPTQRSTKHAWFLGNAEIYFCYNIMQGGVQYRISVRTPILVKSRLQITHFAVTQLFWNFAQGTAVMLFEIISKRLYNSNWCYGKTRLCVIWV